MTSPYITVIFCEGSASIQHTFLVNVPRAQILQLQQGVTQEYTGRGGIHTMGEERSSELARCAIRP